MHDWCLDLAKRLALVEAALDVGRVGLVDETLKVAVVEHVLEDAVGEVGADGIADRGVVPPCRKQSADPPRTAHRPLIRQ